MTTVAPMNDADVLPLTNPPIKVKVAALENLIKVKNATPVYIYLVSVLGVVVLGLGVVLGLELGLDLGLGVGVVFGIKSDPVPVCTCAGGVAASGAACTSAAVSVGFVAGVACIDRTIRAVRSGVSYGASLAGCAV